MKLDDRFWSKWSRSLRTRNRTGDSLDAAKAAAQADYEEQAK